MTPSPYPPPDPRRADEERRAQTRQLYDTVADTYAARLPDTRAETPGDLALIERFVTSLPDDDRPVLDAGCGTGRMLTHLSRLGVAPLNGIDLSPAMVAHARATHPDVTIEVADLTSLPHPDASVRGILCWYAVIHSDAEEVAAILREARRVLMPGGPLLLGFQAGSGTRTIARAYGHDVALHGILHETADIAAALLRAAFVVDETFEREPDGSERTRQGFARARRRDAVVPGW